MAIQIILTIDEAGQMMLSQAEGEVPPDATPVDVDQACQAIQEMAGSSDPMPGMDEMPMEDTEQADPAMAEEQAMMGGFRGR